MQFYHAHLDSSLVVTTDYIHAYNITYSKNDNQIILG